MAIQTRGEVGGSIPPRRDGKTQHRRPPHYSRSSATQRDYAAWLSSTPKSCPFPANQYPSQNSINRRCHFATSVCSSIASRNLSAEHGFVASNCPREQDFAPPSHKPFSGDLSPNHPREALNATPSIEWGPQRNLNQAMSVASLEYSQNNLRIYDVVCGRGAPSSFHPGNQIFNELVDEYKTMYLCSKRSEKPHIVMRVLENIKSNGGRFVKRAKATTPGRQGFFWEEIGDKRAYEKVCQALRDGAPQFRHDMMSLEHRKNAVHINAVARKQGGKVKYPSTTRQNSERKEDNVQVARSCGCL